MMCTRGRAPAPPSCRCVRVVRRGPREGGRGRGEAPEPRAQKKCRRQEHVHPARCTPWCTRRAAQNCGGGGGGGGVRARARRVGAPAARATRARRTVAGFARGSATSRREIPVGGGRNTKMLLFRVTPTSAFLTRVPRARGPARFPGSVARRSARQSVHRSASPSSSASSCSCRRLPASVRLERAILFEEAIGAPSEVDLYGGRSASYSRSYFVGRRAVFGALCFGGTLPSRGCASTRRRRQTPSRAPRPARRRPRRRRPRRAAGAAREWLSMGSTAARAQMATRLPELLKHMHMTARVLESLRAGTTSTMHSSGNPERGGRLSTRRRAPVGRKVCLRAGPSPGGVGALQVAWAPVSQSFKKASTHAQHTIANRAAPRTGGSRTGTVGAAGGAAGGAADALGVRSSCFNNWLTGGPAAIGAVRPATAGHAHAHPRAVGAPSVVLDDRSEQGVTCARRRAHRGSSIASATKISREMVADRRTIGLTRCDPRATPQSDPENPTP